MTTEQEFRTRAKAMLHETLLAMLALAGALQAKGLDKAEYDQQFGEFIEKVKALHSKIEALND